MPRLLLDAGVDEPGRVSLDIAGTFAGANTCGLAPHHLGRDAADLGSADLGRRSIDLYEPRDLSGDAPLVHLGLDREFGDSSRSRWTNDSIVRVDTSWANKFLVHGFPLFN